MKSHFDGVVRFNDSLVEHSLECQIMEDDNPDYGGYLDPETGYPEGAAWGSGIACDLLVSAYYAERSRYFGQAKILQRARLFLLHVLRSQNPDGTMNQKASNYEDTTAAAFTVNILGITCQVMLRFGQTTEVENDMLNLLRRFLTISTNALLDGGFHTPNHRWAICCALSMCEQLCPNDRIPAMIERYLAEGIDQNEDGEYTEKSVSVYDPMIDLAFIYIAERTKHSELLTFVRKNLEMILYYLQGDGTLFTANSGRQDKGARVYPYKFYLPYLYMGTLDNNPTFLKAAQTIYDECVLTVDRSQEKANLLGFYLLHPQFMDDEPERLEPLPTAYEKFFQASGVVRIRQEEMQLTLVRNSAEFLHFQFGQARMRVSLFASFFARGQFIAPEIQRTKDGYRMECSVRYGYIRPLASKPESSAWDKLPHGDWADIKRFNTLGLYPAWESIDHGDRETCHVVELKMAVEVLPQADHTIKLRIATDGQKEVPFKLEFSLDAGGMLLTPGAYIKGAAGQEAVIRQGTCVYRMGSDCLSVSEAFGTHYYTNAMRGAAVRGEGMFSLCFTDQTPIHRTLTLACGKNLPMPN